MFTVPTGFNFSDKACKGVDFVCWPTVAVAGVEYYESRKTGIPGWDHVLLVPTLKRGSLYVLPLTLDGKAAAGHFSRYFQSANRFRDTAVNPNGRTIYIATDSDGVVGSKDAGITSSIQDPGAILAFTYVGEGPTTKATPSSGTPATQTGQVTKPPVINGVPPQFTTVQAAGGKSAYNEACAVCHGTTLTNGTYGTPLAGEYFKNKWFHRPVRDLYQYAQTKMPPSHPGLLPPQTYADILAYILQTNGFKASGNPLNTANKDFGKMVIQ
jgi:mono/diheme cytochrome c family protein